MSINERCFFVAAAAVLTSGSVACKPDFGTPPSLVVGARILAVRGVPAEAAPGTTVNFDVLAAAPDGTITNPDLGWAFCHTPKPPAEANAVSGACLDGPDTAGPEPTFTAPVPSGMDPTTNKVIDACQLFGPQPPPGNPPIRPRDPDVTGGFYQPLRVTLHASAASDVAFELERITCPLSNAPADVTRAFNMMPDPTMPQPGPCCYTPNVNPTIAAVTLDPDGAATNLYAAGSAAAAPTVTVSTGARITLEIDWDAASAETFPVWEPAAGALATQRESLRVSWFASDGVFELDTSGRGEDETELFTRNDWTAPTTTPSGGGVHFWVILRDSRGGLDFAVFDLTVSQ